MKGSIEMPGWYEEYQERELSIRQAAHRNIRMDQIEDRRARELNRKFIGYTMIACMILLIGSIGTIEITEVPPVGSIWIAVLSQVVMYALAFYQVREGRKR